MIDRKLLVNLIRRLKQHLLLFAPMRYPDTGTDFHLFFWERVAPL